MEPEDIIDISDPDIDVQEIMDCIRQRLEARQKQAQGKDYEHLVDGLGPTPVGRDAAEVYGDLHQLEQIADGLRVSPVVGDWRVPLLNGLVNRLKFMLHDLVLLYVNMLAARQIGVNRITTRVLTAMHKAHQADQARIDALETELAALREHLGPYAGAG